MVGAAISYLEPIVFLQVVACSRVVVSREARIFPLMFFCVNGFFLCFDFNFIIKEVVLLLPVYFCVSVYVY